MPSTAGEAPPSARTSLAYPKVSANFTLDKIFELERKNMVCKEKCKER